MSNREIDIADVEHIGALVAGGLLLVAGCKKGGAWGRAASASGLALILRGQQGYRRLYNLFGLTLPAYPTKVGRKGVLINSQIVVRRSTKDLYRIWRNFENLPVFMDHLLRVRELDDKRSQWVAQLPLGMVVKWEVEIVRDIENELISWRSLEGSGVDSAGYVKFEQLDKGLSLIKIRLRYDPPAEKLGVMLAKAFRCDPQTEINHDLRRFKAIVELAPLRRLSSR